MAKPQSGGSGTVAIPESVFNDWVETFLPPGQFYTLGKVKVKTGSLEVDYTFSTESDPLPPA